MLLILLLLGNTFAPWGLDNPDNQNMSMNFLNVFGK